MFAEKQKLVADLEAYGSGSDAAGSGMKIILLFMNSAQFNVNLTTVSTIFRTQSQNLLDPRFRKTIVFEF